MEIDFKTLRVPILFDCLNPIEEYNCDICPSFQTSFLICLKRHILSNHRNNKVEEKMYECLRCYFVTSSRYLLGLHNFNKCVQGGQDKKEKHSVKCKNNVKITLQKNLGITNRESGPSSIDPGQKSSEKNYAESSQSSSDTHSKPIDISSLKFKIRQSLTRNSLPGKIQWFECDHCPLKFDDKHGKDNENGATVCRLKPITMRYRCDQCPAEFRFIRHMRRHLRSCHPKPVIVQWIACDQCPLKFQQEVSLITHKSVCHPSPEDVRWFKCDQCTCKFRQSYYLKNHKKFCHSDL